MDFSNFATDANNNNLPAYSIIVPNLQDDAHDGTPAQADTWLQYLSADCRRHGWNCASLVQLEARENSGSITVNTDLTIHLHREPEGEWIGNDAVTAIDPNGIGLADATLHDAHGPFARALQSLYVAKRSSTR